MQTKVTDKGQITVPKALRERLGIRPGDRLDVREEEGRLIIVKAPLEDPVASVYGILDIGGDTEAAIRALRGAPDAV
jgi:AbrB family looped-hinge helix DNA binding protein